MRMPLICVMVLALFSPALSGQQSSQRTGNPKITNAFIHSTVTSLKTLMSEKYFDTSAIPHIEDSLAMAEQRGDYAKANNLRELSAKLNFTLSQATHDKHLFVQPSELQGATSAQPALLRAEGARTANYGMKRAEVLDGNVGYLQITGFYRADEGADTLAAAMNFVSHTDALILDLRNNSGGSPDTAIQLLSYFFEQPNLPLLSIVPRFGKPTVYITQATGIAYRNESRPVYVLVSGSSWSAGEAVPFILQERHRATIIGEKTAGAANPASLWPINSYLSITIPFGHIKTAVKETSWEGTGVIPDDEVPPKKAFVVAYADALRKLIDSTNDPVKRKALQHDLTLVRGQGVCARGFD